MSRSMVSGGIGSKRQDYFIHVALMLGRGLTQAERKDVDYRRAAGRNPVQIAESIAAVKGDTIIYPRGHHTAEGSAD